MVTIASAVESIVAASQVLRTGLHHGILNLSQVARWIHPLVESRTQKDVTASAIVMALSRLQRAIDQPDDTTRFRADRINLQTGLAAATYPRQPDVQEGAVRVFAEVHGRGEYMTVTEGMREIMVIVEESRLPLLEALIPTPPVDRHGDLASISVSLKRRDLPRPGVLYQILEPLALQNISLVEITSTTTEFHIYVARADAMVAMDSLFRMFG